MKRFRKYIPALLIGLVSISGIVYFVVFKKEAVNQPSATSQAKPSVTVHEACKLFNLDDAKKIIGSDAKQTSSTNSAASELSKQDNYQTKPAVTTCSYAQGSQQGREAIKNTIHIVSRSSSIEQAKKDFEATRASSVEVSGYGEGAYWKTVKSFSGDDSGQLFVIKGTNLIAVSVGFSDLELSKKVAEIVLKGL